MWDYVLDMIGVRPAPPSPRRRRGSPDGSTRATSANVPERSPEKLVGLALGGDRHAEVRDRAVLRVRQPLDAELVAAREKPSFTVMTS